jgi:hypothetical protein
MAGPSWSFPAALLGEGVAKQHTFRVTVSKGNRAASAQVEIVPKAEDVPLGTLLRICSGSSGCPHKHRPRAPLTLQLLPAAQGALLQSCRPASRPFVWCRPWSSNCQQDCLPRLSIC